MRRTIWTTLSLLYVFMLSTVQIYNLYQGYIWVIMPLLSVRLNAFFTKIIHLSRSRKKAPIHKLLPQKDRTSIIISFFVTGAFAFILTGYLCTYEHLVCQQNELFIKPFKFSSCQVDEVFRSNNYNLNMTAPFVHQIIPTSDSDNDEKEKINGLQFEMSEAQIHLTGIALTCCLVSPMMRFVAMTMNKAFAIKEDTVLVDTLGRESSLTDIFYCHGMVGVVVMLWLNHGIYRKDHYYDMTMHYISMLNDIDKSRVVDEILRQLNATKF